MPKSDAKRKSQAAWDAENTVQIALKLNRRTDAEIIKAIEEEPEESTQGKVKALLRRAIKES